NQADAISKAEATVVMPATFQQAAVEVLDSITFQTGDLDFSAQVTRALAKQPDMLFLGSGSRAAALIAKEARKQGSQGPPKGYDGAIGSVTMNELGVNVGQIWALTVKKGVFTLAE